VLLSNSNTTYQTFRNTPYQTFRNSQPSEVRFAARRQGVSAAFTDRGFTLSARASDESGKEHVQAVEFDFFPDGQSCEPKGERQLPGVHNYFLGNDPAKWHTNVPLFEAVRYDAVAPGIAMVVNSRDGRVAYDLHADPSGDLSNVEVTCRGAESIAIDADGSLRVQTESGALCQTPPKAWYELSTGETKLADCRFRVTGPSSYGFEVLNRNRSSKLIVDPLLWSTFLGTTADDAIRGVAYMSGKVTVVGTTASSTFPTTSGVVDTTFGGATEGFVTQFDPTRSGGAQLLWSTFLGGSDEDEVLSLNVRNSGLTAVVCGKTRSSDFPTTSTGYRTTIPYNPPGGSFNAFLARLDLNGTLLRYSSYYGSTNGTSRANAVQTDAAGAIIIVGYVEGSGLFVKNAYDTDYDGAGDAFVARFNPFASGSGSFLYGTYIGDGFSPFTASDTDEAFAVALDGGFIYVAGSTRSSGFHTQFILPTHTVVFDTTFNGLFDCFLMKVDPTQVGNAQVPYATFLGGELNDEAFGLAVFDNIFHVCGYTEESFFAAGFPIHSEDNGNGPFQTVHDLGSTTSLNKDAFLTKLDSTESSATLQLAYSTFLGESGDDIAYAVARGQDMVDLLVGTTDSPNFPTGDYATGSPYDTSWAGSLDMFLTQLVWSNNRAAADQLDYSTYFGDPASDQARSLAIDGAASASFAGFTLSSGFPTAGSPPAGSPPYDASWNGGTVTGDGVVCWFTLPPVVP
jgi:hypothetical protein